MSREKIKQGLVVETRLLHKSSSQSRILGTNLDLFETSNCLQIINKLDTYCIELENQDKLTRKLYSDCTSELHLFFFEYNKQLRNIIELNRKTIRYARKLKGDLLKLWLAYMFDADILSPITSEDVKQSGYKFLEVSTKYEYVSTLCMIYNNKLIVKSK